MGHDERELTKQSSDEHVIVGPSFAARVLYAAGLAQVLLPAWASQHGRPLTVRAPAWAYYAAMRLMQEFQTPYHHPRTDDAEVLVPAHFLARLALAGEELRRAGIAALHSDGVQALAGVLGEELPGWESR